MGMVLSMGMGVLTSNFKHAATSAIWFLIFSGYFFFCMNMTSNKMRGWSITKGRRKAQRSGHTKRKIQIQFFRPWKNWTDGNRRVGQGRAGQGGEGKEGTNDWVGVKVRRRGWVGGWLLLYVNMVQEQNMLIEMQGSMCDVSHASIFLCLSFLYNQGK
jgi:hypothetical protein